MSSATALRAFMRCAAEHVLHHDSAIADDMAQALTAVQETNPRLAPATTPASDILPQLVSGAQNQLLLTLHSCADALHWRQAGFGNLPKSTARSLAVTELIGPDGMFPASGIRIGLLIQHQHFHYPKHSHAAEELYLVLSGTAEWAAGDAAPASEPPGAFIHHRPLQQHSMSTQTEPLLALWGWTGDVNGATYSV